jgi:hypothetical protein
LFGQLHWHPNADAFLTVQELVYSGHDPLGHLAGALPTEATVLSDFRLRLSAESRRRLLRILSKVSRPSRGWMLSTPQLPLASSALLQYYQVIEVGRDPLSLIL